MQTHWHDLSWKMFWVLVLTMVEMYWMMKAYPLVHHILDEQSNQIASRTSADR